MIEKKTNISIQSIFFGFAGKKSSIPILIAPLSLLEVGVGMSWNVKVIEKEGY